jgi:hypothetical protein
MRNSRTSSTSDEIQSSDQIQSKILIGDHLSTNADADFNDVAGSFIDSPHSGFVAAFNVEATPGDAWVVQTNFADLGLTPTGPDGLTPAGTETVDANQTAGGNGSLFEFALNAHVGSSQGGQAGNWGDSFSEASIANETGQSLTIAGSFATASNFGTAGANGVALAPHAMPGLAISGCCPGCLHWLLAEWQGAAAPTLPTGVVQVGDLGSAAAPLAYVNSSQSAQSGSGTSGSVQTVSGEQSAGLTINIIWDSSVANAPAGFESVVESVVQFYESEFSNPVTLNIDVGWGEVAGTSVTTALGESQSYAESFSYSQIVSALAQNASSNAQVSAVNSLPSSAPTSGSLYLTLAEATALGLVTGATTVDGAVGFSSTLPFSYNTSNTGSVPSGQYDLYGVVAHELSEIMGRISLLNWGNAASALDLFRYTANGVLATAGTQNAYFSDNGGATSLNPYNSSSSGDFGDLSSSAGNNAFDAFSNSGVINAVTSNDLTMMNVLGYNLASETIPKITGIAESPTGGAATLGEVIDFTLSFSEAVTVTGTPTLTLNDNGVATYAGGSGSGNLTFHYTVSANDTAVSELTATSVNLNGGTIENSGNNALLSLSGLTQSGPQIGASDPMAIDIGLIYEAVLQRAPTLAEVTASEALQSAEGTAVMTAAIVNSAEAISNVYPVLQMLELAFGHFPSAATLGSMAGSELTVAQLSEAVVASQTFANTFNNGTLLNPDAPVTAAIVEALCTEAVGHTPTQSTLAQWLNSGLSIEQSFDAMVTSQSYLNATLPSIEQYLTAAAGGITDATVANADASNVAGGLTATQINALYEAVLQRAPSSVEVTASLALDSATSNAATVAAIVDSAEAITNIYPILQTCELAFGYLPQASTLASMAQSALTISQLSYAIVGSQTFANMYNGGTLINPNAPVTASIVDALCTHALGHTPTQSTLSSWLNSGLTVAESFQDMVTSPSYFQATQSAIEQYLTAAANAAISVSGATNAGDSVNVVGSVSSAEHSLTHS